MKKSTKIWLYDVILAILLAICFVMFSKQAKSQSRYELEADKELLIISEAIMLENVGVKEKTGRNDGKEIESYLRSVRIYSPAPYCQAFIYYCFKQAKDFIQEVCGRTVAIPIPRSGVAQSSYNHAKSKGNKTDYQAKRNDLIVWKKKNGWTGHAERIYKVLDKGNVLTVGANTSNGKLGSQREGNGVYRRKRNIRRPIGRLRLRGLVGFKERK